MNKREFIKFFAGTSALAFVNSLTGCVSLPHQVVSSLVNKNGKSIGKTEVDDLLLSSELTYQILIRAGDVMNGEDTFGANADYNALFQIPQKTNEYILWTNHESFNRTLLHEFNFSILRRGLTIEEINLERASVGGSLTHWKRNSNLKWEFVKDSRFNRKVSGLTQIPFDNSDGILGSKFAIGTLANCAGGFTPWGTVLTCEENFHQFYGMESFSGASREITPGQYGWSNFFNLPPEHYGWVVEVDPFTGKAKKRISLGRFAHEGATPVRAKNGRIVVYMGDDGAGRCIYKFISDKADDLSSGTLYVANTVQGKWIPLDLEIQPDLKAKFKNHSDLMINTREAAKIVGGTPQDRPEDIEIQPTTGHIYITLTGDSDNGNNFGSIVKIVEKNSDHLSLDFEFSTLLAGGSESHFACPDNLAFDEKGDLWMTNDISESKMHKGKYSEFGNNSLFYIPLSGKNSGSVFKVASAPTDAELTGLAFTPDFNSLILSVQHPGERTTEIESPTSHWPDGPGKKPKSSVVCIDGLDKFKKNINS